MPTTEERLADLEDRVSGVVDLIGERNRLAREVNALRTNVDSTNELLAQVNKNHERIAEVETTTKTLAEDGAVERGKALRRLAGLATLLAIVAVAVVVSWVWASKAQEDADQAKAAARKITTVGRNQCLERNAGLAAAIERERELAKADAESTREVHAKSAVRYQRLIQDCTKIYPPDVP